MSIDRSALVSCQPAGDSNDLLERARQERKDLEKTLSTEQVNLVQSNQTRPIPTRTISRRPSRT